MSSTRLLKVLIPSVLGVFAIHKLHRISKFDPRIPVSKNPAEEEAFSLSGPSSFAGRSLRIEDNATYLSDYKKMSLALVKAFYQLIPDGHKNFPSIFSGNALFFNDYIMMVKMNRLHKAFKDLGIDSDENQLKLVNILLVNGIQYPFDEEKSKDSDLFVKTAENAMRQNTNAWNIIRTTQLLTKVDEDGIKSPTSNVLVRYWVVQTLELLLKNTKEDYESFSEKIKVQLNQSLNGAHFKDALTYKEYENTLKTLYQTTCPKNGEEYSSSLSEYSIPKHR